MKPDLQVIKFLKESNKIENVWDAESLKEALAAWEYISTKKKLTVKNILTTHKILMEQHLPSGQRGYFRKQSVWIGGHEAKPWYAVPSLMEFWIENVNKARYQYQIVPESETEEKIKDDHINFEAIHPFIDGNGRMGRILLNWQRVKAELPILIIKEKAKYAYYEWFKEKI